MEATKTIESWLREEIESYFSNPGNKLFLFFDPDRSYEKIVEHIPEGNFTILKYENNPLKIKYEIEYAEPEAKWVLYLPLSEKSEELSYLKCYTFCGYKFTQSLYAFLKNRGVMPSYSDRKKIAEIKKILPQLAVESVGKDKNLLGEQIR